MLFENLQNKIGLRVASAKLRPNSIQRTIFFHSVIPRTTSLVDFHVDHAIAQVFLMLNLTIDISIVQSDCFSPSLLVFHTYRRAKWGIRRVLYYIDWLELLDSKSWQAKLRSNVKQRRTQAHRIDPHDSGWALLSWWIWPQKRWRFGEVYTVKFFHRR